MQKLKGPNGIVLVIDVEDEHCPADVQYKNFSSSYDFVMGHGAIDDDRDGINLSKEQINWLKSKIDLVEEAFEKARSHWTD